MDIPFRRASESPLNGRMPGFPLRRAR